jgi:phosphate transport system protein
MMSDPDGHLSRQYDKELATLKDLLLEMGGGVQEALAGTIKALGERDSEIAEKLIIQDAKIDELEKRVDGLCVQILATRQPTAVDLRFLTLGLKITTDLERIGDLTVNILRMAVDVNRLPPLKKMEDLPRLAEATLKAVKGALDSFVERDAEKALDVCVGDNEVDELARDLEKELEEYMRYDAANIYRALRLILIARSLERIADHATNIAEQVVFMVRGSDIRHHGEGSRGPG